MVRMTDWKRKELSLEQKTGQIYTRLKNTSTIRKNNLKQRPGEKKKYGIYNTYHGPLFQEWMDGRY